MQKISACRNFSPSAPPAQYGSKRRFAGALFCSACIYGVALPSAKSAPPNTHRLQIHGRAATTPSSPAPVRAPPSREPADPQTATRRRSLRSPPVAHPSRMKDTRIRPAIRNPRRPEHRYPLQCLRLEKAREEDGVVRLDRLHPPPAATPSNASYADAVPAAHTRAMHHRLERPLQTPAGYAPTTYLPAAAPETTPAQQPPQKPRFVSASVATSQTARYTACTPAARPPHRHLPPRIPTIHRPKAPATTVSCSLRTTFATQREIAPPRCSENGSDSVNR